MLIIDIIFIILGQYIDVYFITRQKIMGHAIIY